jgi:threonine-phosphate decarboxylase
MFVGINGLNTVRTKLVYTVVCLVRVARGVTGYRPVLHGGPYSIEKPYSAIVDFSSNVNPLGAPQSVYKILKKAKISQYPDHNSNILKKAIARHLGVSKEMIVVGNGASEIIYNFARATVERGTPVLIPVPTFGEYEAASRMCGGKLEFFKTENLRDDISEFVKRIPRNGVVFVCNPNNPSGLFLELDEILRIVRAAKKMGTYLFLDECFVEMMWDGGSAIPYVKSFENLFVLRSLTKSFGLAGLRIGYGVGSKRISSILNSIKIPWSVNGVAQEAAITALSEKRFLARTQTLIRQESEFLKESLSSMELKYSDSRTNFILIRTKIPSRILKQKLLRKKILVRDCSTFRGMGKNYIRIAVRTRRENEMLVRALESVL